MTTSQQTISDTAHRDGEAFSQNMEHWIDEWYHDCYKFYSQVFGRMLIMHRDFVKIFLPATLPDTKTAPPKKH